MADLRTGRIVIVAALGGVLLAAAIMLHSQREPAPPASPPVSAREADPIGAEIDRCRALGLAAAEDRGCLDAWEAQRRRFFGRNGETR